MFSFSSDFRLKTKNDFQNLRSGSLRISSNSYLIYYKKNNLGNSRLGLSISSKVTHAVLRNNIKRICRESFRCSDFKNKSFDFLIVIKANFQFVPGWKNMLRNELVKSFSTMSFHN